VSGKPKVIHTKISRPPVPAIEGLQQKQIARLEADNARLLERAQRAEAAHGRLAEALGLVQAENERLRKELEAAEKVVEAARAIRTKYPGGKLLWFSEFEEFESALEAYDKARGKGP
jgi:hypothetical protein